jgi:hypothetical protein
MFEDYRTIHFQVVEVSDRIAKKVAQRRIIAALKARANQPPRQNAEV